MDIYKSLDLYSESISFHIISKKRFLYFATIIFLHFLQFSESVGQTNKTIALFQIRLLTRIL